MFHKKTIENKDALNYWDKMASNNPDEKTPKVTSCSDFTAYDAEFILKFTDKNSRILDLASGSGLIINKLYNDVAHITAVEFFKEFSKFIEKSDRISVVNEDIKQFETSEKFDLITLFGIVQYFNEEETAALYEKYFHNLNDSGKLIVKGQFGIEENVTVSGYSEELKTSYYSQYRHLNSEIALLSRIGYRNIQPFDIYPPECNRWKNTHFYAIVANK